MGRHPCHNTVSSLSELELQTEKSGTSLQYSRRFGFVGLLAYMALVSRTRKGQDSSYGLHGDTWLHHKGQIKCSWADQEHLIWWLGWPQGRPDAKGTLGSLHPGNRKWSAVKCWLALCCVSWTCGETQGKHMQGDLGCPAQLVHISDTSSMHVQKNVWTLCFIFTFSFCLLSTFLLPSHQWEPVIEAQEEGEVHTSDIYFVHNLFQIALSWFEVWIVTWHDATRHELTNPK